LVRAKDRAGLLAEITAVISDAGSNIRMLESRPDRQNARVEASLEIVDKRQLETILSNIRANQRRLRRRTHLPGLNCLFFTCTAVQYGPEHRPSSTR